MALRKSTKIALGFALITAGSYGAYQVITDRMIMGETFSVLTPGRVNLVGIDPGAGYRIIVANSIAQLVETSGGFEGGESADGGGATEGSIKKRVPMKELLKTLQGDTKATGAFIASMNDIREDDTWPTTRIVWRAEDLRKAIEGGDAPLRKKLEHDLNMRIDGYPLPTLNYNSLEDGIMIDTPVSVTVNLHGKQTVVTGRVQEPYRPRMIKAVEEAYKDQGDVTRNVQAGYYKMEAEKLLEEPEKREKIGETLLARISPKVSEQRAEAPTRLLKFATIVVNDTLIDGASYNSYDGPDGRKRHDIAIDLKDEGRRRLWQFSKKRVGTQLLLVTDGIPISAPRIQHELAQSQMSISRLDDEVLVREAVNMLNEKKVATR
ncbi:hypothetical protein EON81_22185 [bacterium]|nr:MAG: hypothetical protein EON81_22185 [bacterium]